MQKLIIMKKTLVLILAIFAFSFSMNAQITMSLSANNNFQKTTFGYNVGNLQPYIGLGVISLGGDNEYVDFGGEKYKYEFSLSLVMPNLGLKAYLIDKGELKAGLDLGIYKPIVSGSAKYDGEEDEELQEILDNLSLFGAELGFFSEYYFNDRFSVGGEFGFRYAKSNYDFSEDDTNSLNLKYTYTAFNINFHF